MTIFSLFVCSGWQQGLRHLPNNKHSFYYAADRDLLQQQAAVNCQLKFMQPAPRIPHPAPHFSPICPRTFSTGCDDSSDTWVNFNYVYSQVAQKWHRQHGHSTGPPLDCLFFFIFPCGSTVLLSVYRCQIALRVCSWRAKKSTLVQEALWMALGVCHGFK